MKRLFLLRLADEAFGMERGPFIEELEEKVGGSLTAKEEEAAHSVVDAVSRWLQKCAGDL